MFYVSLETSAINPIDSPNKEVYGTPTIPIPPVGVPIPSLSVKKPAIVGLMELRVVSA